MVAETGARQAHPRTRGPRSRDLGAIGATESALALAACARRAGQHAAQGAAAERGRARRSAMTWATPRRSSDACCDDRSRSLHARADACADDVPRDPRPRAGGGGVSAGWAHSDAEAETAHGKGDCIVRGRVGALRPMRRASWRPWASRRTRATASWRSSPMPRATSVARARTCAPPASEHPMTARTCPTADASHEVSPSSPWLPASTARWTRRRCWRSAGTRSGRHLAGASATGAIAS